MEPGLGWRLQIEGLDLEERVQPGVCLLIAALYFQLPGSGTREAPWNGSESRGNRASIAGALMAGFRVSGLNSNGESVIIILRPVSSLGL